LLIAVLALVSAVVAQAADQTQPARHANGEHPAVLVARQAVTVNANTFIVQPPASVTWTVQPEAKLMAIAPQQQTAK
jgi:hypothetical protein